MSDFYAPGDESEEDELDNLERFQSLKDHIVFLVDASAPMHEAANIANPEALKVDKAATWMTISLSCIVAFIKRLIISGGMDKVCIVFYGTSKIKNDNSFDGVYELQALKEPGAKLIRNMENLQDGSTFENTMGAPREAVPEDLKYGLWVASTAWESTGLGKALNKRLMIFTRAENPCKTAVEREQEIGQMDRLAQSGVHLELFPLVDTGAPWNHGAFWADALPPPHEGKDEHSNLFADSEDSASGAMFRLQGMAQAVRQKAHRKRALQKGVRWQVGDNFEITVSLYILFSKARVPTSVMVEARTLAPTKREAALICADSGAVMPSVHKVQFARPKGSGPEGHPVQRFPTVLLDKAELVELKRTLPKGLRLLGFKRQSLVRDYHQIKHSYFVYPDERSLIGSTAAFIALHHVLLASGKVAICSHTRVDGAKPALVALCPQKELVGSDDLQLAPPGMHMLFLPFADDIRAPERDSSYVGIDAPYAEPDQVEAAADMLEGMSLLEYSLDDFLNPKLQRHYEALEAFALAEEPSELEEFEDPTEPEALDSSRLQRADAFKASVGWQASPLPKARAAGIKRKAPEELDKIKAEAEELGFKVPKVQGIDQALKRLHIGVFSMKPLERLVNAKQRHQAQAVKTGLAAANRLGTLTLVQLKVYLIANSLKKTGKKAELIERVQAHLGAT